jgi:tRNA U34 5-methylaminomethyl-2-thiouridine-forming methyltransferase MnmC
MDKLSLITTTDGSHTIKNESTGDTYHSIHGATQESNHVFIQNGLKYLLQSHPKETIRILEVGFGTGLNALLTISAKDITIEYTALEPYPLTPDIYLSLNFENREMFLKLHQAVWENPVLISPAFTLVKYQSTLQLASLPENYFDLIYYDAFAPKSQPELWELEIFRKIKKLMTKFAVLVTYCAKGQVKRDLKTAGFIVESIPGPPGKREMIRAIVI